MKKLLFLLLLFKHFSLFSQDADALLQKVVSKISSVKDYSVNAFIRTDIPFIKMLPINAKIYFKQKDKFKIASKGIVIIPKQGFTDVNNFLLNKKLYTTVDGGTKTIGQVKTSLIILIPVSEDSEFILAKLWVDPVKAVIISSQITTKTSGMLNISYTYASEIKFGLPSQLIFEIDTKKFKLPKSVTSNKKNSSNDNSKKKGVITIKLSNYIVNKGINDAIFEKK